MEPRAGTGRQFSPELTAMGFDEGTADRQTQSDTIALGGEKWLEYSLQPLLRKARAAVLNEGRQGFM